MSMACRYRNLLKIHGNTAALKIICHTDYQTTANIYTHIKEEMLKKATVDLNGVFKKHSGKD